MTGRFSVNSAGLPREAPIEEILDEGDMMPSNTITP